MPDADDRAGPSRWRRRSTAAPSRRADDGSPTSPAVAGPSSSRATRPVPDARGLAEAGGWPLLAEPSLGAPGRAERHRHLPAAARPPRRRHRAGRRRRASHPVPRGDPAAGPRRRRGGPAARRVAHAKGHGDQRRAWLDQWWTPTRSPRRHRPRTAREPLTGLIRGADRRRLPCRTAVCSSPDRPARFATSTSPTRGSRAAAGAGQPRCLRHRRHRVHRDRRRPRARRSGVRPAGRPHVPARQHRPGDRPGRAAAGPHDRRRQRRRRRAVHPARAGCGRARGAPSSGIFGTPHGVDLAALCAATGTAYVRVDSLDDLGPSCGRPSASASSRCAPTAAAPGTCTSDSLPPSEKR